MAQMQWTLARWLKTHGVTKYELAQNMDGNEKSRLTTLYRMRDPQRVDLNVMAEIVSALREITGEEVTPNDLLKFVPDPKPQAGVDAETRAWMDADKSRLGEYDAYEWEEGEADEGELLNFGARTTVAGV